jgi:hypothetical protein
MADPGADFLDLCIAAWRVFNDAAGLFDILSDGR